MSDHDGLLADAAGQEDRARRALLVAAAIGDALERAGCHPVLVGGAAVEIYTRSAYTTFDLDFVAASTEGLAATMGELGFERSGRHWLHRELSLAVEFPGTVLAPARSVSMDVAGLKLTIIAVEDLIVDRLASWKRWGWDPDGAAAALLLGLHSRLDRARLEKRAAAEDVSDALQKLRPLAGRGAELSKDTLRRLRRQLMGAKR